MTTETGPGRRERKKRETGEAIARAAAALFAERGYESVTVLDIAEAADVSEQTVYNHFPTKEHLVFSRADEFEADLAARIQERPAGMSVIGAVRADLLNMLDTLADVPPERLRGGMPWLVASAPGLRRWQLEMTARHAEALAALIAQEEDAIGTDPAARVIAYALLAPYQVLIEELGRRLVEGQSPRQVARALRPVIQAACDRLGRGLDEHHRP